MKFFNTLLIFFCLNQAFGQIFQEELLYSGKINSRAIYLDKNKIWLGMNQGRFGIFDLQTKNFQIFSSKIISEKTEIRSIAGNKNFVFLLPVGNPANLVKIDKTSLDEKLVYQEIHEKAFYDSMHFGENGMAFAMGDPTDSCLSFIRSNNNGESWEKISCKSLPTVQIGEAAFAASNSTLKIIKNKIILVSGGKNARVFISQNQGENFEVFDTPIIHGETMTGIFSMDFYDENLGIVAGGNYENQHLNFGNLASTKDGGKTWKLVSEGEGPGYISCIQYVPKSKGKKLVSAGGTGIYFSKNSGESWEKISDRKDIYAIKFLDKKTFIGAGNKVLVKFTEN